MVPNLRFSRRINITIAPHLLRAADASAEHYGTSRSAIIHWALNEWLERHPHQVPQDTSQPNFIKTDPKKAFREFIRPDMDADKILETLEAYEDAWRHQV